LARQASATEVGTAFGAAYELGSFAGMLLGGWLGSRLTPRDPRWAMWIAMVSYVAAAPLAFLTLIATTSVEAYLWAGLMSAAATAAYGPAFALIQELAPPRLRAVASATALFFATLVGAGFGPLVVGFASDALAGGSALHLRDALLGIVLLMPLSALCYYHAARRQIAPVGLDVSEVIDIDR